MVQLIALDFLFILVGFFYFNSTMVQLIVGTGSSGVSGGTNFNSTMVQLIGHMVVLPLCFYPHFNSTMVQLIAFAMPIRFISFFISILLWFN